MGGGERQTGYVGKYGYICTVDTIGRAAGHVNLRACTMKGKEKTCTCVR